MQKNNLTILLFALIAIILLNESCNKIDCLTVFCKNGGTCVNGSCECAVGFYGATCLLEDSCITKNIICQNGGSCENGSCKCLLGFSGEHCEIENLCFTQNIICQNGGNCVNGACNCPPGFYGDTCEIIDSCIIYNIVCQNGGTCIDNTCDCPRGYIGTYCENFDRTEVQYLLDIGVSPEEMLINGAGIINGIVEEDLHGKVHQNSFLFFVTNEIRHFNTTKIADRTIFGPADNDILNLENHNIWNGAMGEFDGSVNTMAIVDHLGDNGGVAYAAKLCDDLVSNGFDDWYLPTLREYYEIHHQLYLNNIGNFISNYYWTSSEADENFAYFYRKHFNVCVAPFNKDNPSNYDIACRCARK